MIPSDAVTPVVEQFHVLNLSWFAALFDTANWLFSMFVILEIVTTTMRMMIGGVLLWDILADTLFRLCFFKWLIFNADWVIPHAINGFIQLGAGASGIPVLNPESVVAQGISVCVKLVKGMGAWGLLTHPISVLVGFAAALVVFVAFIFIAIQLAVTLIESYLVTGVGVLLLGFAGWGGTRGISMNYVTYIVGVGVKLLVIYLLIGAGQTLAIMWANMISTFDAQNLAAPLDIAAGAAVFGLVVWKIPSLTASLLVGSLGFGLSEVVYATRDAVTSTTNVLRGAGNMMPRSPSPTTPGGSTPGGSNGAGGPQGSRGPSPAATQASVSQGLGNLNGRRP